MHTNTLHPRPRLARFLPLLINCPVPRGDGAPPQDENLKAQLAKHGGDAMALAAQLVIDMASLRTDLNKAQRELTAAEKKILKDGEVAVSAEDGTLLGAYKPLGTPDELKAAKTERDTFKTEKETLEGDNKALAETNAKTQRDIVLHDIAELEGFKFSVLADRDAATPGLSYETKEVEVDGKKVKKAFVKFKDGEGESAPMVEKALSEFAAAKWADYLPSLQVAATDAQDSGRRHVAQGGGTGNNNGGGDFYSKIRKDAEEKAKNTAPVGKSLEERLNMRPGGVAASAT